MDKYQLKSKRISKELSDLSKQYKLEDKPNYHNQARYEINQKYGKGWREELDIKSINEFPENHKNRFTNMSYY